MTLESGNDLLSHPACSKLRNNGYENEEEQLVTIQVYIDLVESKGWHKVELCPVEALRRTVVVGHSRQTDQRQIVLPSSLSSSLTMTRILEILDVLKREFNASKVLLGFVDPDSTVVYYSLTDDLVPPEPTDAVRAEKQRQKAKNRSKLRQSRFVTCEKKLDSLPDSGCIVANQLEAGDGQCSTTGPSDVGEARTQID